MALILKSNKTFQDESGNVYGEAYGVVGQISSDKRNKLHTITFVIYKNHSCRNDLKRPVAEYTYGVGGDDFDMYFSPAAITADDNQWKQSYLYLLQLKNENEDLIYGDWQSDEI